MDIGTLLKCSSSKIEHVGWLNYKFNLSIITWDFSYVMKRSEPGALGAPGGLGHQIQLYTFYLGRKCRPRLQKGNHASFWTEL